MQIAVIEFARNVAGLAQANSSEFNELTPDPVIYLMLEWYDERTGSTQRRDESCSDRHFQHLTGPLKILFIQPVEIESAFGIQLKGIHVEIGSPAVPLLKNIYTHSIEILRLSELQIITPLVEGEIVEGRPHRVSQIEELFAVQGKIVF